ncbi:MAG: hypothetical protein ACOYJ6_17245 [Caulobacterales bacterium]
MKQSNFALVVLAGLSACAPPASPAAAPNADRDYTLERKPTPGDPASALIFEDRVVLSVFGDDGSISTAEIRLQLGAAPPPGLPTPLGLVGDWVLHPVTVDKRAANDRNGLCRDGAPAFVLKQVDGEGAITLVGYRGANAAAPDPSLRCEAFRFRP